MDQLKQDLRAGKIAPVYVIQGVESAIVTEAQAALRKVIPDDMQSMNFAQYDLHEVSLGNALNELAEPPFFGDYREIMISNPDFLTGSGKADSDVDALTNYLKAPADSTVLVFIATYPKLDARKKVVKALKKVATFIDAAPLNEGQARSAIKQQLRGAKVDIESAGLDVLFSRTQGDYSAMVAAVPILATYALTTGKLDAEDVALLVPKQLTDSVFDLVSAVLKRNVTEALSLYRDLLAQKEEPLRLISLLESQFRLLLQVETYVARGYTQGAAADQLSVHPYRIKLAWGEVRRLRRTDLDAAYIMLVNTEAAMKRGTVDKVLGFELFVLQFAGQGKNYRK
ncbi:DNA polymerase III subunit delta [Lacticaseibacillus hulanensis]|uniref:DNA polymerase III subunit delta n=1 Tax=Lacticaseibacillus hulanensis TaxID=2493111 RepID=UPI003BAC41DA